MTLIGRSTRARHSRLFWGGASLLFLALLASALLLERSALSEEEQAAQDLAVRYTDTVLFEALDADLLSEEIRGRNYRDLIIEVQGGIMTDEGVARVRIWAPDATLLFSTESLEQIGVAKAVNTSSISAALGGEVSSVVSDATVAAKSGLSGTTQRLYQTFAPIRVRERTSIAGVAQIDRRYSTIAAAAAQPWRALQIGLGCAALLCLVLLLLSMRRRSASRLGSAVRPPSDVQREPVPADRNPLRLRNELERERQTTRRLQAELEEAGHGGTRPDVAAASAGRAPAVARLAEAESALAEAAAHTAELERSLAEARAQAVSPATLSDLEERVLAAETRARQAEHRLQDLNAEQARIAREASPTMTSSPIPPRPTPSEAPAPPSEAPAPPSKAPAPPPEEPAAASEDPAIEPTPEALDLRSRLARTAARKKLGSHVDDEPGS